MAAKMNTPEFRAQIENIRVHALKSGEIARLSGLSILHADSLFKAKGYQRTPDGLIFKYNDNSNSKVRQTEEYKKLKEKFDNEVKELKEKMEKKEKKEKVEGGNKSSQVTPAVMLYNNQDFTSAVKGLNTLNAVVTYKKSDFTNADQIALKTYVQGTNLKITNDNTINISIK